MTATQQSRTDRARHYVRSVHAAKGAARDLLVVRGVVRPECSAADAWRVAREIEGHRKRPTKPKPGATERQIADAIEAILRTTRGRWAPIADLRAAIPARVKLSRNDKMASLTRPGEPLFFQKVRNLVCHAATYRGRFVFERGGIGLHRKDNSNGSRHPG